jgi:hypothetical protein
MFFQSQLFIGKGIYNLRLNSDDASKLLVTMNMIWYEAFQLLSLMFNVCLCIDLILTLRNPFSPGGRRLKFYLLGSITSVTLLILITTSYSYMEGNGNQISFSRETSE